jgi:hypothetical protein
VFPEGVSRNAVAADVSRRTLKQAGTEWRELTFTATGLIEPFESAHSGDDGHDFLGLWICLAAAR